MRDFPSLDSVPEATFQDLDPSRCNQHQPYDHFLKGHFFADFDRFSFLGSPLHQLRPVALSQPPFQLLHLPASLRGPTMSFLPSPLLHLHHNQGHFPPSPHPRQRQLQIKIGRQILCSRCNRPPALLLSQPSPPHPCP